MSRNEHLSKLVCGALAAVLAVALAPGVQAGSLGPRPRATSKKPRGKYPYLGSPRAKVTMEVFGDFQCPWTQRLAPTLLQITKAYPRKVKIVWRDFPLRFHRRAMPAAIAAREVFRQRGTKGFIIIATQIFNHNRNLTDQNLLLWAGQAGADTAKVSNALKTNKHQAAIQSEMKRAQARGVRGTPTILFNGLPYKGQRTLSAFRQTIDAL
ncbi:MAG: thioredoxin domain-containing protein [bacterium]